MRLIAVFASAFLSLPAFAQAPAPSASASPDTASAPDNPAPNLPSAAPSAEQMPAAAAGAPATAPAAGPPISAAGSGTAAPASMGAAAPLVSWGNPHGFHAQITGSVRASLMGVQSFPTDIDNTALSPAPFETRIRVAPQLRYSNLGVVAEVDLVSGALSGLPSASLGLGESAHPVVTPAQLRQLYLEYKGDTFVVRAGQQSSNWGLGLVANNGNEDAGPGDFGDAHSGDLAYRAAIAGRPLFGMGGLWRAIEPILAADLIVRDDTASYFDGDRAVQGVLALRFNKDANHNLGVYTVYRQQRLEHSTDGRRSTDAAVLDVAGRWHWEDPTTATETKLALEAAWITGTTTLGRSETAPELSLNQFGAVVKGSVEANGWETYLDVGYASGDQNPYDNRLEGFRFDPDYRAGLVLYQEVLGWQSARTYARATDPNVMGHPPEGADLLPTRGAITGSMYMFPRLRRGFREWLDLYGGPLFAVTTASMVDAFNTRMAGGMPRNSLGGSPGRYLGTELDLGIQARMKPVNGMALTATAEGAYFMPGSAFTYDDGRTMPPVAAGRLRVGMSF